MQDCILQRKKKTNYSIKQGIRNFWKNNRQCADEVSGITVGTSQLDLQIKIVKINSSTSLALVTIPSQNNLFTGTSFLGVNIHF